MFYEIQDDLYKFSAAISQTIIMSYEQEQEKLKYLQAECGIISEEEKPFIESDSREEQTALISENKTIGEVKAQEETEHTRNDSEEAMEFEEESDDSDANGKKSSLNKDKLKWSKVPKYKNVRTRSDKIVIHLPGVRRIAREKQTVLDCWLLFFTEAMLDDIVRCANVELATKKEIKAIQNCSI